MTKAMVWEQIEPDIWIRSIEIITNVCIIEFSNHDETRRWKVSYIKTKWMENNV